MSHFVEDLLVWVDKLWCYDPRKEYGWTTIKIWKSVKINFLWYYRCFQIANFLIKYDFNQNDIKQLAAWLILVLENK